MHRRNHRGFTLLELIVVLVIISLMSALVVPKLAGPMSNLDLKTASQKISASLRYARSRAASEKTTYAAVFDFDKNRLVVIHSTIPPLARGDFHIGKRLTGRR
jgi:general secretion pathway protein H